MPNLENDKKERPNLASDVKKSFRKNFAAPFTDANMLVEHSPRHAPDMLDRASTFYTIKRYRYEGKEGFKFGKLAHDVLLPTRVVASALSAATLQIKKGEVAIDAQDWGTLRKAAAKTPLVTARLLCAASSAIIHTPELITTPIARGMRHAVDEIRSGIKSQKPDSVGKKTTTRVEKSPRGKRLIIPEQAR